jgi:hypothetical protein
MFNIEIKKLLILTCSVRKTNVGGDTECVVRKISPALEVVAYYSLHRKLFLSKLRRTVVVQQIPAEHGTRQCRRGLGSFMNRNNLSVLQFFGTIIIMTVLIMEPVPLELNDKIQSGHKSATDIALTPIMTNGALDSDIPDI